MFPKPIFLQQQIEKLDIILFAVDVTTEEGAKCAFPFKYDGKYYGECTITSSKPWCGTKADYDKEKEWSYCILLGK